MGRAQIPTLGDTLIIFYTDFKLMSGGRVRGSLSLPKDNTFSGLENPRRVFFASAKSPLVAGNVIIGSDQRKYLLMDNGVYDPGKVDFKSFKVVELTEHYPVRRKSETVDPITKRTVKSSLVIVEQDIWFNVTNVRSRTDGLHIDNDAYQLLTYYPLQVGDLVGDQMNVRRVEKNLGVYIADVD